MPRSATEDEPDGSSQDARRGSRRASRRASQSQRDSELQKNSTARDAASFMFDGRNRGRQQERRRSSVDDVIRRASRSLTPESPFLEERRRMAKKLLEKQQESRASAVLGDMELDDLDGLTDHLQRMEEALTETKSRAARQSKEKEMLLAEVEARLEDQQIESKVKLRTAYAEKAELQRELNLSKASLQHADETIQRLTRKLDEQQHEVAKGDGFVPEEFNRQLERERKLRRDAESFTEDLQKQLTDAATAAARAENRAKARAEALEKELTTAQEKTWAAEAKNTELRLKLEEEAEKNAELEALLSEARSKLRELRSADTATLADMNQKVEILEGQLDQERTATKRVRDAAREKENSLKRKALDLEEWVAAEDELMAVEINRYRERIQELVDMLATEKDRAESLQDKLDRDAGKTPQIIGLMAKSLEAQRSLQAERATVHAEMQKMSDICERLDKVSLRTTSGQTDSSDSPKKSLSALVTGIASRVSNLEDFVAELSSRALRLEDEKTDLSADLRKLTAELKATFVLYEEEKMGGSVQREAYETKIDALQADLDATRNILIDKESTAKTKVQDLVGQLMEQNKERQAVLDEYSQSKEGWLRERRGLIAERSLIFSELQTLCSVFDINITVPDRPGDANSTASAMRRASEMVAGVRTRLMSDKQDLESQLIDVRTQAKMMKKDWVSENESLRAANEKLEDDYKELEIRLENTTIQLYERIDRMRSLTIAKVSQHLTKHTDSMAKYHAFMAWKTGASNSVSISSKTKMAMARLKKASREKMFHHWKFVFEGRKRFRRMISRVVNWKLSIAFEKMKSFKQQMNRARATFLGLRRRQRRTFITYGYKKWQGVVGRNRKVKRILAGCMMNKTTRLQLEFFNACRQAKTRRLHKEVLAQQQARFMARQEEMMKAAEEEAARLQEQHLNELTTVKMRWGDTLMSSAIVGTKKAKFMHWQLVTRRLIAIRVMLERTLGNTAKRRTQEVFAKFKANMTMAKLRRERAGLLSTIEAEKELQKKLLEQSRQEYDQMLKKMRNKAATMVVQKMLSQTISQSYQNWKVYVQNKGRVAKVLQSIIFRMSNQRLKWGFEEFKRFVVIKRSRINRKLLELERDEEKKRHQKEVEEKERAAELQRELFHQNISKQYLLMNMARSTTRMFRHWKAVYQVVSRKRTLIQNTLNRLNSRAAWSGMDAFKKHLVRRHLHKQKVAKFSELAAAQRKVEEERQRMKDATYGMRRRQSVVKFEEIFRKQTHNFLIQWRQIVSRRNRARGIMNKVLRRMVNRQLTRAWDSFVANHLRQKLSKRHKFWQAKLADNQEHYVGKLNEMEEKHEHAMVHLHNFRKRAAGQYFTAKMYGKAVAFWKFWRQWIKLRKISKYVFISSMNRNEIRRKAAYFAFLQRHTIFSRERRERRRLEDMYQVHLDDTRYALDEEIRKNEHYTGGLKRRASMGFLLHLSRKHLFMAWRHWDEWSRRHRIRRQRHHMVTEHCTKRREFTMRTRVMHALKVNILLSKLERENDDNIKHLQHTTVIANDLSERVMALTRRLDQENAAFTELTREHEGLKETLLIREDRIEFLKKQKEDQVSEMHERAASMVQDFADKEKRWQDQVAELHAERGQDAEEHKSAVRRLKDEIAEGRKGMTQLEELQTELNEQIHLLEKERRELEHKLVKTKKTLKEERSDTKQKSEKFLSEWNGLRDRYNELTERCNTAEAEVDAMTKKSKKLEALLKWHIASSDENKRKADSETSSLLARLKLAEDLQQEYSTELDDMREKTKEHLQTIKGLELSKDEMTATIAHLNGVTEVEADRLVEMEGGLQHTKSDLAKIKAELSKTLDRVASLEQEKQQVLKELNSVSDERHRLRQELADSRGDLDREKKSALDIEVRLQAQIKKLQSTLKDTARSATDVESSLRDSENLLKIRCSELEHEVHTLRTELEETVTAANTSERKLVADANTTERQLLAHIEELQTQIKKTEQKAQNTLQKSMKKADAKVEDMVREMHAQIANLERELEANRSSADDRENHLRKKVIALEKNLHDVKVSSNEEVRLLTSEMDRLRTQKDADVNSAIKVEKQLRQSLEHQLEEERTKRSRELTQFQEKMREYSEEEEVRYKSKVADLEAELSQSRRDTMRLLNLDSERRSAKSDNVTLISSTIGTNAPPSERSYVIVQQPPTRPHSTPHTTTRALSPVTGRVSPVSEEIDRLVNKTRGVSPSFPPRLGGAGSAVSDRMERPSSRGSSRGAPRRYEFK